MDQTRWRRIAALFEQAVELPIARREQWVRAEAAGDPELAEAVLRMLERDESDHLLDRPLEALAVSLVEPSAPEPSPPVPERVGDYEIQGVLGRGGMGVVYRARDRRLGRLAALKFLPAPGPGADHAAVSAIEAEARAASALDHPNIATIYHVGADDAGRPYIAMAHYEGQTLAEHLKAGPLAPAEAVRIAGQVAAGLAAAHAHGIVHRDVKPANIFLTGGGAVKLLDFGIAAAAGRDGSGAGGGTLLYMSPEESRATAPDPRSDVWSLGAVLYEMLAGRPPFEAETPRDLQARKAGSAIPPLPQRPGITGELRGVVARALARDPGERYPDAGALLAALERIGQRRLSSRLAGGVLALAVLAAAAIWRLGGEPSGPEPSPSVVAVFPFEVQGDSAYAYLREGMVNLLSADFDGVGGLRGVDPRAIRATVGPDDAEITAPRRAAAVARSLGAGRFILGQILGAGRRLRASASLYGAGGVVEATAQVEVPGEEAIFELVDRLAGQLLARHAAGADQLRVLAASTTRSLPALKLYLEGEALMRSGRFEAATAAFERAVSLDTAFALASYGVASARWWADREGAREPAARALRHAGGLPRAARMELEGQLARLEGDFDRAERIYQELIVLAPEAPGAWFGLADVLHHYNPLRGRSLREAIPYFERGLALQPDNMTIRLHLANIAVRERNLPRHDSLLAGLSMSAGFARYVRLVRAFVGRDSAAQAEASTAFAGSDVRAIGEAVHYVTRLAHNVRGALRFLDLLEERGRNEPELRRFRAGLELTLGRWQAAMSELRAADSLGDPDALQTLALWSLAPFVPSDSLLWSRLRSRLSRPAGAGDDLTTRPYLRGLLSVRLGDTVEAERIADSLEAGMPPSGDPRRRNAWASIGAELALRRGDSAAAQTMLEQLHPVSNIAIHLQPASSLGYERFLRGELLRTSGRSEEALGWYRGHVEASMLESIYLAPSHFRAARLHEAAGRRAEAAEQERRFDELWGNADPAVAAWASRERQ